MTESASWTSPATLSSELTKVRPTGQRHPPPGLRPSSTTDNTPTTMAPMPETLVPLDDVRKMKRSASNHSIESKGESGTESFQIRAVNEAGRTISLWHDVSLVHIDPETQQPTPYLNFVCEIPKFTRYGSSYCQPAESERSTTPPPSKIHCFVYTTHVPVCCCFAERSSRLRLQSMGIPSYKTRRMACCERYDATVLQVCCATCPDVSV
jgi:hypothetical protein